MSVGPNINPPIPSANLNPSSGAASAAASAKSAAASAADDSLGKATTAPAVRVAANSSSEAETDAKALLIYGEVYKREERTDPNYTNAHPLSSLPTPKIDRPFVMIPGWTTTPDSFQAQADHLTAGGANGGQTYFVKEGKFYTQTMGPDGQPAKDKSGQPEYQALGSVPKDAKVFEMLWSDPDQDPQKNLPELKENLDAITKATGSTKVDAEGYSMGGLDSRLYLENGGNQIGKLFMLGTPNQGAALGDAASGVLEAANNGSGLSTLAKAESGAAAKFGGLKTGDGTGSDEASVQDLSAATENPWLQSLNANWTEEASHLQGGLNGAMTFDTDYHKTAADSPVDPLSLPLLSVPDLSFVGGDGMVAGSSVALPGVQNDLVNDDISHHSLPSDVPANAALATFLGWGSQDAALSPRVRVGGWS